MTHQILSMTKVACVGIWWSVSKKENWLFFQEIQGISTAEEIQIQDYSCRHPIILLIGSYFLGKAQVMIDKEDLSEIYMLNVELSQSPLAYEITLTFFEEPIIKSSCPSEF